jgi:hypothetical protein
VIVGCEQNTSSLENGTTPTDITVSNNLRSILLNLYCTVNDGGHYPESLSAMTKYDIKIKTESNKTSVLDLNSNYFVCPDTGTHAGTMTNVDDWTDYIYVGNSIDSIPSVALIISPPENHHGKYGYVVTPDRGIMRLPPSEVRALVIEPWLLATNETAAHIDDVKRYIKVNVPLKLQPYYTNVNNWIRPPLK